MIVQCATFSKSLNPRNIDKNVSDIRIRIRFPFESSLWISVSSCELTILPDIQPANRIVIISDPNSIDNFNKMLNQGFFGFRPDYRPDNQVFFGFRPDWRKYLDRSPGLRSDLIIQWKFWIGLGLQKSPIFQH